MAWKTAGFQTAGSGEAAPRRPASGRELYGQHCATCHQADGLGKPGHYPALAGNGLVTMPDSRALILVTLHGLSPKAAPGKPEPARMPSFGALSDRDVAAILTHVRQTYGNGASPVTTSDVKAMRSPPGSK